MLTRAAAGLLLILLAGCAREPQAAAPAATPAPSPVAGTPSAAPAEPESAPAAALRGFWRERDAGQWGPAHRYLSRNSQAALPEKQLAEQAATSAPTEGSGAAWAALFTRSVAANSRALPTVEEGDGARVEVATPGGPGVVLLVREAGAWKIDLLKTLSSSP